MAYKNLAKILKDKGVSIKAYAEFLGVSEKTAQNKMRAKTEFTLGEARKTCTYICPEYKMDYVLEMSEEEKVAV